MFGRLAEYKRRHGDCLVPVGYSDKQLANWIHNQRRVKNRGKLDAARIQRLEMLGFVWDAIGESWEHMFGRLAGYKQQHGDCLILQRYSDKQLAHWVNVQRTVKNRGKLEPARVQRLEELGFVWKVRGKDRADLPSCTPSRRRVRSRHSSAPIISLRKLKSVKDMNSGKPHNHFRRGHFSAFDLKTEKIALRR